MNKTEKRMARCLCLEILYAHASTGSNFTDILDNFFTKKNNILDYQLIDAQIKYASKLYDATLLHSKTVDSLIESKLVNWEMKRLALLVLGTLVLVIAKQLQEETHVQENLFKYQHLKDLNLLLGRL